MAEPKAGSTGAILPVLGVGVAVLVGAMTWVSPGWPRFGVAVLVAAATGCGCLIVNATGRRASALWSAVVVLSGAAVAIGIVPDLSGVQPPVPPGAELTAAERVQACMSLRHMDKPRDRVESDLSSGPVDADAMSSVIERDDLYKRAVYRDCSWPPGPGASPDGYYSITELVTVGPGAVEATRDNVLHRITATCSTVRLTWTVGSMGFSQRLPDYNAKIGDLIEAWAGQPYVPGRVDTTNDEPYTYSMPYPYPRSTELVVVSNSKIGLDDAHCVG